MVTFANGTQLETMAVYGGSMSFQGAQRSTLEIVTAADSITLDAAKGLWQNAAATAEMTVSDGAETSVHLNYTLPVELKANTLNGVDVVRIKLAQKSVLELIQEKQAQDIEDANAALCELAEIVAGGENDG